MMRNLLVTGGCGFIGANFIRFVLHQRPDWRITNLDCLSYSGNLDNLADLPDDGRYEFVKGDINDRGLVQKLIEWCDAIVHFAAETHVDRSIMDARPFVQANVMGTQTLLDALVAVKGAKSNRFIHISTDEVYGSLPLDRPELRFTEASTLEPSSPYSASKAAGDLLVLACCRTFGINASVTRCSNNIGPYQFPEKVIPLFVTNLLEGKKVPLYGDGRNVRDWIHVEDHCEAVLAVLERGEAGEVYNIGADNERSNLELTHAILQLMGAGGDMIEHVQDRPGHDRRYAVDASKIRGQLGWTPTRSGWPAALEHTVNWYRNHRQWCRRVQTGEYRQYLRRQYGNGD